MNGFDIGYVMGLFVGEGCFTSYRRRHGGECPVCSMRLHVRDPQPLLAVQRLLGGKIYGRSVIPLLFEHLPESHKRQHSLDWLHKHELFLFYPRYPGRSIDGADGE
jgi:hypothetical protein